MKKRWFYILLLTGAVAAFTGYWLFSRKTPDAVIATPFKEFAAADLIRAFEQNGTQADKVYSGKILRVSGTVTSVDTAGSAVLGSDVFAAAIVIGIDQRHAADIQKIQVGDQAVFQGVYTGYEPGGSNPDDLLGSLGGTIQLRSAGLIRQQ